ncbi:cytochrome P450 4C1-like [Zootermopsis nevadensis]|uniref:cytochrome P450 4C1-like n=1 Tax=Zootermopsis nevadensis TaxID=136037 RepID=UPI000B8E9450|nr:cytochrome P450 4C1-like [Zootermopsis nevadensis]
MAMSKRKLACCKIPLNVETCSFALFFQGLDTTSTSICWAIYLLGLHTDIQNNVYEELKQIFQGSDRPAKMKFLSEMKYFERVIKESLRLYPVYPSLPEK